MTSRDLWGKVFVICLQRVGIFLKGKWDVWIYVGSVHTVFVC
jgi:hypothetical protein